jgi:LPS-assembly protein
MLRSSSFWIVSVLLASIMPWARAADPPCPSQIAPAAPGAATPPAPAAAAAAVTPGAAPTAASSGAPAPGQRTNIVVTSDAGTYDVVSGNVALSGDVTARQGDREIRASELRYDAARGALRTDGHIDYQDPLVHVSGDGGSYSAAAGADFHAAQFSLKERAARGTAKEMSLAPDGVMRLKGVTFTTCPLEHEAWRLKASRIVLDTRDRIGTGHDAQVDFMGVPLMYLPWLSFPLSPERKSGFLFPGIGNTSTNGVQVSVPYYWNIAPNYDFTFEPIYYSKAGTDLGGEVRFLTAAQRGELDWNYLPYDRQFGASRSREHFTDLVELPADFRLDLSAENVSDTSYFEDFSKGPEGASTAFLERRATLSYRSEHWRVEGEAQQYQTIDDTLPQPDRPYARVPRLVVDTDYSIGPSQLLHYGFQSEVVDFKHSEEPDVLTTGWRTDVMPHVSLDLTGPGYFVRPAFAWRATYYDLNTLGPGQQQHSPARNLPIASLDTGLLFERMSGSHSQRKLTLEPRILYLDVPYRDQSQLPVFDTALPDLNPVQLFRTNRYVGADRVSDANQVSIALTSRLLDALSGRQFIAATLGETFYFESPRVTLPGEVPVTAKRSDLVAQIALTAFEDWSADIGVQWDPQNQRSERTLANLQYKPAINSVINLAYRYERFSSTEEDIGGLPQLVQQGFDQVELSAAWPIRNAWHVFAREVYSLRDPGVDHGTELERFAGVQYRSCCWRMRLGARRYVSNRDGSTSTGIWLQLELAGLAGVGSASDAFLTDEIRGYTPPGLLNIKAQGPLKGVW